ncbi:hypothetical protein ACC702_03540 [Rhizobium ruizarguesonis]|jgi:hypothetical protein|nr:hypothetical protein [Rhizobium ruizarguesonis]
MAEHVRAVARCAGLCATVVSDQRPKAQRENLIPDFFDALRML